jgi:DHA3 family tetracycline resistance protein-like MFS transporter
MKQKETKLGFKRKLNPLTVYLILEFSTAFTFWLIFTVDLLYHVTVVNLSPFQLVLMGTILEVSAFVFEIPTGVLADVKSRRLSVIIGYVIMGLGFIVEGSLPIFGAIALAQVIWGLGYTFTSGATQAWIADEVGEEQAGQAFLRGSQLAQIGHLAAIPLSTLLGSVSVALPVVVGGGLMIGLAAFLALTMTEDGFTPTPPEERTSWGMMIKTVKDARQLVRRQPILLTLLGIMFFYGLYSEGLDRLWTAHLLEGFAVPLLDRVKPVVWFGAIQIVSLVFSLAATEAIRQRVDANHSRSVRRILMLDAGATIGALAGFALTRSFWVAAATYCAIGALRAVVDPLYTAWFNRRIDDSQVRATMFSVTSQTNAVGQVVGGPGVGVIGNRSIRAALVTCALLLSPVLALYASVARLGTEDGQAERRSKWTLKKT